MTLRKNTKRGIWFTAAVTASLAVLVPATLSYAMPSNPEDVNDLTFSSGLALSSVNELSFATTLGSDDLWKETPAGEQDVSVLESAHFKSVDGWCSADLWTVHLSGRAADAGNDLEASKKLMDSTWPGSAPNDVTEENWVAFKSQSSGRIAETINVHNDVSFTSVRANPQSDTGVIIHVTCADDDELAKALTDNVRSRVAITVAGLD